MKIVMYHYVRDYENTRYPYIKGLDVRDFEFQIQYLNSKYNVLNPKEVHQIVEQGKNFKAKDCWLTFDDGYIDHYNYVLPLLERYKLKASFFPPVVTTQHKTVLDFNKIHFVLANNNNHDFILNEIKEIYVKLNLNNKYGLFSNFIKKIDTNNPREKYGKIPDSSNITLIKRLLQHVLPEDIRKKICEFLFKKYVSDDLSLFAKKLYMNLSQINEICTLGHEIGVHGHDHISLVNLLKENQNNEIMRAVDFWKKNKLIKDKFTICYPYGSYNSDTLSILSENNCLIGLTTKAGPVLEKSYTPLELPRIDTNDFPQKLSEISNKIY